MANTDPSLQTTQFAGRDYSGLTREQLEVRLNAAEDVTVLYGWCPTNPHTTIEREQALFQLWKRWTAAGGPAGPEGNEHLTDAAVAGLARERAYVQEAMRRRLGELISVEPRAEVSD